VAAVRDRYQLEVAGTYAEELVAREVEAALISALRPAFNRVAGHGHRFAPLGIPPQLADAPHRYLGRSTSSAAAPAVRFSSTSPPGSSSAMAERSTTRRNPTMR
jgi:hypothetical protein